MSYPSDLRDEEWEILEPLVRREKRRGPKSRADLRQMVNGIRYVMRTGCQWRALPKDFGSCWRVYGYFYRWQRNGTLERINTALRQEVRKRAGREEEPTAAIIDSQSVKTVQKGGRAVTTRARKSKAGNAILA